jgi:hypothetical protein
MWVPVCNHNEAEPELGDRFADRGDFPGKELVLWVDHKERRVVLQAIARVIGASDLDIVP